MYRNTAERFWARVDKSGDCWLWTGRLQKNGYAQVRWTMAKKLVHRLAWELTYGEIPDGFFVCHHCDVRNCVRPTHLFLGTSTDNVHDMHAKGRARNPVADAGKALEYCLRGHAFDVGNTYIRPSGDRDCRACRRERYHTRYRAKAMKQMRRNYRRRTRRSS